MFGCHHPLRCGLRNECYESVPQLLFSAEALANQVRHLDEERAAVATEAGLELSGERTEAVADESIVVSDIKRRAGIGCVAKEELSARVRRQRVVVQARAHEREPIKLIRAAKRVDVVLECKQAGIVTAQFALLPTQRHV